MTRDEKAIWTAVFAARCETFATQSQRCRGDIVIDAAEEADRTILALRRVAAKNDGHVHQTYEIMQEEKLGRGIDIVHLSTDGRIRV